MKDLMTAVGLILFLEGLLFAVFPSRIKNMLKKIEHTSENKMRTTGIIFLTIGFLIVWYIKN
jgi:uncharacterized protein YjeT (DUF2065 family)|tara:strand:+ start:505 stop:690 length:186 start_codon:yes stop_codon:yes gene_type:complete